MGSKNKYAVYVTGGDKIGWALDTDLNTISEALGFSPRVSLVDNIGSADVVLSVSYKSLLRIPQSLLKGRMVLAQLSQSVDASFQDAEFYACLDLVDCWLAPSHKAFAELKSLGIAVAHTPYLLPKTWFEPLPEQAHLPEFMRRVAEAKAADRFIVGNFHRDSEGRDICTPKLDKGPDLFLEVLALANRQAPKGVLALLAGPRRHWLRGQLRNRGIDCLFAGQEVEGDDLTLNALSTGDIRALYALCDAYLVSSRSEGGPRTLLEAIAAGVPVISTPVGLCQELLAPRQIYTNVTEGCSALLALIERPADYVTPISALQKHRVEQAAAGLELAIAQADQVTAGKEKNLGRSVGLHRIDSVTDKAYKAWLSVKFKLRRKRTASAAISIWYDFHKPPYGGGNQFALALEDTLRRMGVEVHRNAFAREIDGYILNGFWFDEAKFARVREGISRPVLHRIDGPSSLVRGDPTAAVDEDCARMNERFATHTVLQSAWSARALAAMNLKFRRSVVIRNAADSRYFFRVSGRPGVAGRKIRIIGSSWSNNPRKGAKLYREFSERLDHDRFEFIFVGRVADELKGARMIAPCASKELGDLLRQADIYITASQKDPCSNALIEALACGLPAAYLHDGGHPELVGFGGAGFSNAEEALLAVERIASDYEAYQRLIAVEPMTVVARKYLAHMDIHI